MPVLESITIAVDVNEPCSYIEEVNLLRRVAGLKGTHWRRIQRLQVVRGDRAAWYEEDLGPVESFTKVPEFNIVGAVTDEHTGRVDILETVARMRWMAADWRDSPRTAPFDDVPVTDIAQGYIDTIEQAHKQRKRQSMYAGDFMKQRPS
jgi:hypothetical protein